MSRTRANRYVVSVVVPDRVAILRDITSAVADLGGNIDGISQTVVQGYFTGVVQHENNPFMAGAFLGSGEPECVINVGVSGPGVVKRAIDRLIQAHPDCSLGDIAEEVKHTAFRVTRSGELVGREVAQRLGVEFGVEDHALAQAVAEGALTIEKLEAMTAVCSVGLDMILLPGDIEAATLAGIILDEAAIGVTSRKTTGVRIIPVPGRKVGDRVDFGGLFGSGTVTNVNCPSGAADFVNRGSQIPAPVHSLTN